MTSDPPRGFLRALEAQIDGGLPGADRRGEEGEPVQGTDPRRFRAGRARPRLSGGRSNLPFRADRRALFQGQASTISPPARAATHLPALRKDFLFDPYQVYEARAAGADCILIIMACVNDCEARALNVAAHDLKMDVLVEAHDEAELDRALALETRLIGINNRNLPRFQGVARNSENLRPARRRTASSSPKAASPATPTSLRLAKGGHQRLPGRRIPDAPVRPHRGHQALLTGVSASSRHDQAFGPVDPFDAAGDARMVDVSAKPRAPASRWRGAAWSWRPKPWRSASPDRPKRAMSSPPPASPASWRPSAPMN